MLQMLRTATTKFAAAAKFSGATAANRNVSPYQNYMCYQDGRPFMVINAPSLEHAQFIIAGFSADHVWLLAEMNG